MLLWDVKEGKLAQPITAPRQARQQVTAIEFIAPDVLIATTDSREGRNGGVRAFRLDASSNTQAASMCWRASVSAATCIGRSNTGANRFWTGSLRQRSRVVQLYDINQARPLLSMPLNGGESDELANEDINVIVESYCGWFLFVFLIYKAKIKFLIITIY